MKTRTKQILAVAVLFVLVLAAVAWAAGISRTFDKVSVGTLEFNGPAKITRGPECPDSITLDPGLGLGSTSGKLPMVQTFPTVAAAAADSVHAAITIPTGATAYTDVTADITQPDVYRCLSITGSASAALSTVEITGTTWDGSTVTDLLTGTGAATKAGHVAFKTITNIRVWGVATPGGATYTVGCTEALGLYRRIAATADVVAIDTVASAGTAWVRTAAGALPTGAAVIATQVISSYETYSPTNAVLASTVDPETSITAADAYIIYYLAKAW